MTDDLDTHHWIELRHIIVTKFTDFSFVRRRLPYDVLDRYCGQAKAAIALKEWTSWISRRCSSLLLLFSCLAEAVGTAEDVGFRHEASARSGSSLNLIARLLAL